MDKVNVKFKKMIPWAKLPEYETKGAAGCDISIAIQDELILYPNEVKNVSTGFALEIPSGYEAQIRSRAGMAKKGIIVANAPGTLDSDHIGEVRVLLLNITDKPIRIVPEQKVAQIVFAPVVQAIFDIEE